MATVERATPRGSGKWKNRFGLLRGSKDKQQQQQQPPEENDRGEARSLSAKRNQQRRATRNNNSHKSSNTNNGGGGGGLIRKLKTLNNSFRKEPRPIRNINVTVNVEASSDSSPSNPQSPFSTDSFVTVEVSKQTKQAAATANQQKLEHYY
jgi:hypothetical protein